MLCAMATLLPPRAARHATPSSCCATRTSPKRRRCSGRRWFISVHEAKGLECPHVVLMGLVSGQRAAYAELCDGVTAQDLERGELEYRRARDKGDKSLELYKFYVNALYVAMTRRCRA